MTTFLPLIIVLGISMVKEAVEDFGRYRADKNLNTRMVSVYNPASSSFEQKQWRHIQVGRLPGVMHTCELGILSALAGTLTFTDA